MIFNKFSFVDRSIYIFTCTVKRVRRVYHIDIISQYTNEAATHYLNMLFLLISCFQAMKKKTAGKLSYEKHTEDLGSKYFILFIINHSFFVDVK